MECISFADDFDMVSYVTQMALDGSTTAIIVDESQIAQEVCNDRHHASLIYRPQVESGLKPAATMRGFRH